MAKKQLMKRWLFGWALWWATSTWAMASHIIGGHFTLIPAPRDNEFVLSLYLLYDDIGLSVENQIVVSIFKKADNNRLSDFTLMRSATTSIPFANARCAGVPVVRFTTVKYETTITLPPSAYNDPAGYYMAWEQCCRNASVVNLARNTGLTFYLEFPARTLKNATPVFNTPEILYACRGQNYELFLGATDADNDALQYSLVSPFSSFADQSNPSPSRPRAGPYPLARWNTGFDSTKIAGTPSQIDRKTGKLIFTPTQTGRYALAVRCEEFRNNQKIGEIRRDFEIVVVDCVPETVPAVTIEIKTATPTVTFTTLPNGQTSTVQLCTKDSLTLKANDEDPKWLYQWFRDGKGVVGATSPSLSIKEAGNYSLVKRIKQGCRAQDSTFATTIVTFKSGASVKITPTKKLPLCYGDSLDLSATLSPTVVYNWFYNDKSFGGGSTLSNVKEAGWYKVSASDANTKCNAQDSVLVNVMPLPVATLSVQGNTNFCAKDSTKLSTTKSDTYDYVWYLNQIPTLTGFGATYRPTQSGNYSVVITDTTTGCTARSASIDITYRPSPTVTFDSIPPLCGTGIQAVMLNATPKGGIFSGRGVIAGRFVSQSLPAGSYPVTYTYVNTEGCPAQATRAAVVMPPPKVSFPSNMTIFKGESVEIVTSIPPNAIVRWFPSGGLSDATSPRPIANPDRTTTYTLTVTTREGCVVEGQVMVSVIAVKVPNGFTPNGDGANDTWEIEGIDQYPNATVEVLNRWGAVVFSAKGYLQSWDGTWQGEVLPVGTYYYRIYLREVEQKLTGSVSIIR